jgi:hypothetical protein
MKSMKSIVIASILIFVFGLNIWAQEKTNCPTLDVTGGGVVERNVPLTFTANVGDYDLSKLTFNWTVSSGEIIEGQGTPTIKVLLKNNGLNITAIVEVKVLPNGCVLSASETGAICACISPSLFDEYGLLNDEDFKARLQNLFVELGNNPGSQGYMIIYGTKRQISRRKKLFLDGMAFLKLDASRLTMVNGGANPNGKGIWTKVWIVPPGARNPTP